MTYKYSEYKQQAHSILGNVCSSCGSTSALELHHKDETAKQFNPSRFYTRNLSEGAVEEIKKCELLCEECHKIKHQTAHGKRRMYNKGCRCDLCRESVRQDMREYRRKEKKLG